MSVATDETSTETVTVHVPVVRKGLFWNTTKDKIFEIPKHALEKDENIRKMVEEELQLNRRSNVKDSISYNPKKFEDIDNKIGGLLSVAFDITCFNLEETNLKFVTQKMLNVNSLASVPMRGFAIDTKKELKFGNISRIIMESVNKFKNYLMIKDEIIEQKNVESEESNIIDKPESNTLKLNDSILKSEDNTLKLNDSILKSEDKTLELNDSILRSDDNILEINDFILRSDDGNLENSRVASEDLKFSEEIQMKEALVDFTLSNFKKDFFYFMNANPFIYYAIIDGADSFEMVKAFEEKFGLKGLTDEFRRRKLNWFDNHNIEELDEDEIKEFVNYFNTYPIFEKDCGNIKYSSKFKEENENIITLSNYLKEEKIQLSYIRSLVLSIDSNLATEMNGIEKSDLIKKAKELVFSKRENFSDIQIDELYYTNPKEWAKNKVIYYSDKAFFGIPCKFICLMLENWVHGNHILLGGTSTRYLNN